MRWESFVALISSFGLYIFIENKTIKKQPHPADVKLFQDFLNLLPAASHAIYFLKEHDFKAIFEIDLIYSLARFKNIWNDAEHQFIDKEIEHLKLQFHKAIVDFLEYSALHTFPTTNNFQVVPKEWQFEQSQKYFEVTRKLNNLAGYAYEQYRKLVEKGRIKLIIEK